MPQYIVTANVKFPEGSPPQDIRDQLAQLSRSKGITWSSYRATDGSRPPQALIADTRKAKTAAEAEHGMRQALAFLLAGHPHTLYISATPTLWSLSRRPRTGSQAGSTSTLPATSPPRRPWSWPIWRQSLGMVNPTLRSMSRSTPTTSTSPLRTSATRSPCASGTAAPTHRPPSEPVNPSPQRPQYYKVLNPPVTEALTPTVAMLQERLETKQTVLDIAQEAVDDLKRELAASKQIGADQRQRISDLEQGVQRLRGRLTAIRAELDTTRAELGARIYELEAQLNPDNATVSTMNEREQKDGLAAELGDMLRQANARIAKLEAEKHKPLAGTADVQIPEGMSARQYIRELEEQNRHYEERARDQANALGKAGLVERELRTELGYARAESARLRREAESASPRSRTMWRWPTTGPLICAGRSSSSKPRRPACWRSGKS